MTGETEKMAGNYQLPGIICSPAPGICIYINNKYKSFYKLYTDTHLFINFYKLIKNLDVWYVFQLNIYNSNEIYITHLNSL